MRYWAVYFDRMKILEGGIRVKRDFLASGSSRDPGLSLRNNLNLKDS